MNFLYFLEKFRVPVVNEIMLGITRLGEELALLIVALIVFWCIDKRRGYFVLGVGLIGTVISQFMKIMCRIPRPWVLDENFTILEQAREAASGYSFPSGHTQTAFGVFGSLSMGSKRKLFQMLCIVLAVFVGFSRMYIGVHTPVDVFVGAMISISLVFLLYPLMMKQGGRHIPYCLLTYTIISVMYLAFLELHKFPQDIDVHNMESAMKNGYTLVGTFAGLLITWLVDQKRDFPTSACFWAQVLKIILGFALVLGVKEGLRSPLDAIFGGHLIARAVRYFLIVFAAGIVWPTFFPLFSRFGKKNSGGN